jgi:hypothetical protein
MTCFLSNPIRSGASCSGAIRAIHSPFTTKNGPSTFFGNRSVTLCWRIERGRLPHITTEVQKLYEYPQQFAEDIFLRVEQAFGERVAGSAMNAGIRTGRLYIVAGEGALDVTEAAGVHDLPVRYILSSVPQLVDSQKAESIDQTRLLAERREGEFLVSYQVAGGWIAISKDVLTEVLGAGRNARIVGLPVAAAGVLGLMLTLEPDGAPQERDHALRSLA